MSIAVLAYVIAAVLGVVAAWQEAYAARLIGLAVAFLATGHVAAAS